jgi:hypothetical protein
VQWGKQHSEELSDLYLSPIIVRGINPRWLIWVVNVAYKKERWGIYKVL